MKTPPPSPRRRRAPVKQHHPFVRALGATLRAVQRRRKLSDTALAAKAGLATATVGNFADGFCDPKVSTVCRLCVALRVDIVRAVHRAKRRWACQR